LAGRGALASDEQAVALTGGPTARRAQSRGLGLPSWAKARRRGAWRRAARQFRSLPATGAWSDWTLFAWPAFSSWHDYAT